MSHNIQTRVHRRYALGWAALLCMYCVPYSAPAQSQDTHATEAFAAARSPSDSALRRSPDSASHSTHPAAAPSDRAPQSERNADKLSGDTQSQAAEGASADFAKDTKVDASSLAVRGVESIKPTRAANSDALTDSSAELGADGNAAASNREQASARPLAASSGGGPGVVNINSAGAVELERLPRIGPARAQAILALRTKLRQFSRIEQLLQVKGIGRATFRMLRPLLALNGPTTLERKRGR